MADSKTPAERAALTAFPEPYDTSFTGETSRIESLKRAGFIAGWEARPVLTRDQIAEYLWATSWARVTDDDDSVEWSSVDRRSWLEAADDLLAQGDVPGATA